LHPSNRRGIGHPEPEPVAAFVHVAQDDPGHAEDAVASRPIPFVELGILVLSRNHPQIRSREPSVRQERSQCGLSRGTLSWIDQVDGRHLGRVQEVSAEPRHRAGDFHLTGIGVLRCLR
jgi:hypothetical protein